MESLPSAPLDTQHILSWHLGAQPVTDRVFTSPLWGEDKGSFHCGTNFEKGNAHACTKNVSQLLSNSFASANLKSQPLGLYRPSFRSHLSHPFAQAWAPASLQASGSS